MLPTRLAQTTAYALSHQAWDHFLNKINHITCMFMLLNAVMIGIIHAIFSPCKLSAIDDRIRNFTQQHYILQVVYALSKFSQEIGLL